ncbi:MAG: hypothetical protein AB1813_17640 [Verrucomicrobiota bacterium]
MDNHEAKFILQSFRPQGQDANDPAFAEALKRTWEDPELARWFAEERSLDAAIAGKLKQVKAPDDLRTAILAGGKVGARQRGWTLRWPVLAWAASIVLLLALSAFWFRGAAPRELAAYQRAMLQVLETHAGLEFYSPDPQKLAEWLKENNVPVSFTLPEKMKSLSGLGCQCATWNGKPVGLLCMKADGGQLIHLFVIRSDDLPSAPRSQEPILTRRGEWTVASWTRGETTYLLAGLGGRELIRKYL